MKWFGRTKRIIKFFALFTIIIVTSPYVLSKLNFYGSSHATPPPPATMSAAISSTSLNAPVSYADAVALAAPAVVSIKTTKEIPMEFQDPFFQFRYFFGEPPGSDYPDNGSENGKRGR